MQIKRRKIIDSVPALQQFVNYKLRAISSSRAANALKFLNVELEMFQAERKKLQDRHATKNEKGENVIKDGNIVPVDLVAFEKEFNEYMDEVIELPTGFKTISLEQLGDVMVEPILIHVLDWLIDG